MSYSILLLNWQDIRHPLGGGAEVHLHEVFRRIASRGHRVTQLCCRHPGMKPVERIDGITIVRSGSRRLFNFTAPRSCRKLINNGQYDIVIDCINKLPLLAPLYVRHVPVLGVVHHLFKSTIFKEAALPQALYVYLYEKLIRPVYKNTPFCVISPSTLQDLTDSGIAPGHIEIVAISIDHDLYKTSGASGSDEPLIGYLGRIKKYKSVDHLIRAFAAVRKTVSESKLIIIGGGDNLEHLKKLTRRLNLEQAVQFTGFVEEHKKVAYLRKCAVVVNPSAKEGWGLTVIEANACGVPVIAADVPGLRDSVIDGKTGLLYPYGDTDVCAKLIINLLQDREYRKTLRKNALEWAAGFTWDAAADKTFEIIEKTIKNHEKSCTKRQ